jgi:hypothetical protein
MPLATTTTLETLMAETDVDATNGAPSRDLLASLMFERLTPPVELQKLIALGYATGGPHSQAATVVDTWLASQEHARAVLHTRLRQAEARIRDAEAHITVIERRHNELVAEMEG